MTAQSDVLVDHPFGHPERIANCHTTIEASEVRDPAVAVSEQLTSHGQAVGRDRSFLRRQGHSERRKRDVR